MKSILFGSILFLSTAMISCEKSDAADDNNGGGGGNNNVTIQYDFTANMPAEYFFVLTHNNIATDDSIVTQNYSRSFTIPNAPANGTAKFEVFPPESWIGTTNQAEVNLRISVNGVQRKDTTGIIAGVDRPTGVSVTANY